MRIDDWIEDYVDRRRQTVLEYFSTKRRKNVQMITRDAQVHISGARNHLVQ